MLKNENGPTDHEAGVPSMTFSLMGKKVLLKRFWLPKRVFLSCYGYKIRYCQDEDGVYGCTSSKGRFEKFERNNSKPTSNICISCMHIQ
jgi:hypothetical protein